MSSSMILQNLIAVRHQVNMAAERGDLTPGLIARFDGLRDLWINSLVKG